MQKKKLFLLLDAVCLWIMFLWSSNDAHLGIFLHFAAFIAFVFPRNSELYLESSNLQELFRKLVKIKGVQKRFICLLALGLLTVAAREFGLFSIFTPSIDPRLPGFSLTWLYLIPCIYLVASACSWFTGRILLNPAEKNEKSEKKTQAWVDLSMGIYQIALLLSFGCATFMQSSIGPWFANWTIAGFNDANLFGYSFLNDTINVYSNAHTVVQPAQKHMFILGTEICLFAILSYILWPVSKAIGHTLTLFLKERLSRAHSNLEAFLSVWRRTGERIAVKPKHPLMQNIGATLGWLLVCYLTLFGLFGFSKGPIGDGIEGWMDASVIDARFKFAPKLETLKAQNGYVNYNGLFFKVSDKAVSGTATIETRRTMADLPQLRIFLASIIALYGTAPLAVTGCVFLPYGRRRRILLNSDGICLPWPVPGLMSTFRLWSDLKCADVVWNDKQDISRAQLKLQFGNNKHSIFSIHAKQLKEEDLEKLLASVDEFAENCKISEDVLALRAGLQEKLASTGKSHEKDFRSLEASSFSSTVFVPAQNGQSLPANPDTNECLRVVRQLSSKPLSAVYVVRKASGGLAIAKQFYLSEDTPEADSMRRYFEREYKVLEELNHPRIAKIIDCFSAGESSFLIIDFVRGTDLRKYVRENGAQGEAIVRRWARELAEMMMYLHNQASPVLHRDLTPDNIVLADDGKISIIDFGAAHNYLEHITGTMIGKKSYAAPEQLRGHAEKASDIYSFGCTLHYLLTGMDPLALSESCPGATVKISYELDELVKACTNFEAAKRPASFEDIIQILDGYRPVHQIPKLTDEMMEAADPLLKKFSAILLSTSASSAARPTNTASDTEETENPNLESPETATIVSLADPREKIALPAEEPSND